MVKASGFLIALLGLAAILAISPNAQAGICSTNGYPAGSDCSFISSPAQFYGYTAANCPVGRTISYNCNGAPSKYQNGCINNDYYDYGYTTASVQVTRGAGNTCGNTGDWCSAVITRNDPRCGYQPPTQTPGTQPTYSNPTHTESSYPYTNSYSTYTPTSSYSYGYCGDFSCQWGEDLFNCPIDCGLFVPWPQWNPWYNPYPYYYPPTYYPPAPTPVPTTTVNPSWVPTPIPLSPSCAISASPSKLTINGTSTITATYANVQGTPQGTIVCGDGQVVPAACTGTGSGSCTATCVYSTPQHLPAQFIVSGTLNGRTCANGGVTIEASSAPGRLVVNVVNQSNSGIDQAVVQVNGKTQYTNISGQTEFSLNAGNYLVRASKAKHANAATNADVSAGGLTHVTLQLKEQFSTLCSAATSPSTIRGGQQTSVTVTYTDAKTFTQTIPIVCGNGQNVQATCTGDASTGSCTATCSFLDELPYPRQYNIDATVSGQHCNPAKVSIVAPLSNTGNFIGRITACTNGQSISNAEIRISQPQFSIPTNFTGDGSRLMNAGQTVRLSNGYIVRLDLVATTNATLSFLNSQGQSLQQNTLIINQTAAIQQAIVQLLNITGTTAYVDARSLAAGTPYLQNTFYSDDNGQVTAELIPGTYSVDVVKDGYNQSSATFTVQQSQSTTKGICLEPRTCDFGVELVSAPTCNVNSDQYQMRISNSQNTTKNVTLTYSSTEMQGPNMVALLPNQATIVSITARTASSLLSGQSLGIVNIAGPDACTKTFTLPLCIDQKVVVQAPQDRITTAPGKTACTTLLLKNRALQNVRAILSAQSNVATLSYTFSPQSVMLSSLEVKNIQLCATPQSGSSGAATLNIFADSAFGQTNATLSVETFGQGFFSSDFAGCPLLDADRNTKYALNVQNTGEDGDFTLSLDNNELSVRNEYVIQQFQKGSTRTVSLQLEPQGTTAGRHLIDYYLKQDGRTVFQDQLCFDVRGTSVAEARVQPNPLDVPKGQTRSALMVVHNLGSLKARYFVAADGAPLHVRLEPNSFVLSPNEESIVNVIVTSPDAITSKAYTIPLKVTAQTALTSLQEQYSVDVQCGDGQTKTVTCPAGTGSCTATCNYGSTGFYTPSANVGGRSCGTAAGTVQVLTSTDQKCILQASPNNVNQGSAVTVTASFNSLTTPLNGTLNIQCGNGQVAQAVNCNGNSGSCSTVCNYPDSGTFTLTATQGANVCEPARIAVGNPSQTVCQISTAPSTIRTGESATITLRYYNLPVTGTTSSTLNVPVFVDSDNLLVNILDKSDIVTLSTAELSFSPISPTQVFPGTTLTLQLQLRNDNYFVVDNIAVYAKNVPAGFMAQSPARFNLKPGQERLVSINIQATQGTQSGTYAIDIVAESPKTLAATQKALVTVLSSTASTLNVDVDAKIAYKQDNNVSRFILDVTLKNKEPVALTLAPSVTMKNGWPNAFNPPLISLAPDGTAETQGQVVPTVIEPGKDYEGTLRIQSSDGRFKDVPIILNDQGGTLGNLLGGLVTFGEGTLTLIGLAIILLLLAVAAFFIASHFFIKARTEA